jgi:hypothetical protein
MTQMRKLMEQKLKTRDLIADITLNNGFVVSTVMRVFLFPLTV